MDESTRILSTYKNEDESDEDFYKRITPTSGFVEDEYNPARVDNTSNNIIGIDGEFINNYADQNRRHC